MDLQSFFRSGRLALLTTVLLVLGAGAAAPAAVGLSICVDGVDGLPAPSSHASRSTTHGLSRPVGPDGRSGALARYPFHIHRQIDAASVPLLRMLNRGMVIDRLLVVVERNLGPAGDRVLYQVTLDDCRITDITLTGFAGGPGIERLTVDYDRIAWQVLDRPTLIDTGVARWHRFGWDADADTAWEGFAPPKGVGERVILLHVAPPPATSVDILLEALGGGASETKRLDAAGSADFDGLVPTDEHLLEFLRVPGGPG